MINILIVFLLLIFVFYLINENISKEHFYVTTWTPYIVDYYNQPGFTNYFYKNGYMYPIY